MSQVDKLLEISDLLDKSGKSLEADYLDSFISKFAKRGLHKCGLKEGSVELHLELLEEYKKALAAHEKDYKKTMLSSNGKDSPNMGELREALKGIAYNKNAVMLHEMFLEDFVDGKPYDLSKTRTIESELKSRYKGTSSKLLLDLKRVAKIPRNGWVLLSFCTSTGDIYLDICDSHDLGHIAGHIPILVIDLWEHAYFNDFGSDKEAYIDWCWERLDWRKVEKRLKNLMRLRI